MKVRRVLIVLITLLVAVPAAYALNPTDSEGGTLGDAGDTQSAATQMARNGDGRLTTLIDRDDWYRFDVNETEIFALWFYVPAHVQTLRVSPDGNTTVLPRNQLHIGEGEGRWYIHFNLLAGSSASYDYSLLVAEPGGGGGGNNTTSDAYQPPARPPECASPPQHESPETQDAQAETPEPTDPAPELTAPGNITTYADLSIELFVEDEYDGPWGDALEAMRLVRLRVVNHGDAASPEGVVLKLSIDARSIHGVLGESGRYLHLPALEPGHEAAYEHRWDTSRAIGEYLLTAKVDAHNIIAEPIETDNLALTTSTVRLG